MAFAALDWIIVIGYITACATIGVMVKRYIRHVADFAMAGRSVGPNMGLAGMTCTGTGMVAMVYTAEMAFHYGFAGALPGVMGGLASLIVGTTGFMIGPMRRARVTTVPEMLERRFGKGVRWLAGLVVATGGLLNMGIFLRLGGEFLVHATGLNPCCLTWAMISLLAIAVFYTTVGGMVAVVVTNYFQFLVLGIGMLTISAFVLYQTPWNKLTSELQEAYHAGVEYQKKVASTQPLSDTSQDARQQRADALRRDAKQLALQYVLIDTASATPTALTMGNPVNPLAREGVGLIWIIWQLLFAVAAATTWQTGMTRALSSKDTATSKRVFRLNTFHPISSFILPGLWAIGAYLYFCKAGGLPEGIGSRTATPEFLARLLPSGVIGLVTAGMLAAEMSTDSSYILTWATVIYNDLIMPCVGRPLSERAKLRTIRVLILLIGVFLVVYGLYYNLSDTAYNYITVTGTICVASMFALLMGAIYMPWINRVGAYAAIILGAVGPFSFVITNQVADESHRIAAGVAGLSGFAMAFGGLVFGSLLGNYVSNCNTTGNTLFEPTGEQD